MQGTFTPGPAGGVATSQSPPFTLPMRYMLLGLCGFALFALDLVVESVHLSGGVFLPRLVALTHLLTLGSLLSFVMGAVYQLLTVTFLVPIISERGARLNFWSYLAGIAGLIGSMAAWWPAGLLLFGTLTTLSLFLYGSLVIASVRKTQIRNPIYWFVQSAHVHLMLAIAAAWMMILSVEIPPLARVEMELLATHIILAVVGFFTFLVMGFSFKLLPMFTLSHGFSTWRQKWTLALAHAAVWMLSLGVWSHGRFVLWLGVAAGLAAFVFLLLDFREIMKKRLRKVLEPPVRTAVAAAVAGLVGIALLGSQLAAGADMAGWQSVVAFYLLGWITFTVMGYAYKIVPFLIWTRRYSTRAGKEKVPLIADLLHLNRARPVLRLFAVGLVAFTLSTAASYPPGVVAGSTVLATAIAVFCIQLFGVIDVRKTAKELTHE